MSDIGPQPELRSKEEIVEEIYKNKEPVPGYEKSENYSGFILKYGSKNLKLMFEKKSLRVSAYIENTAEDQKLENETTLLYKAAKKTIQGWAEKVESTVTYQFTTQNENLKKWALDPEKGAKVFSWDSVREYGENEQEGLRGRLSLTKRFEPTNEQK
jgi:hypothetical protein